MHTFIFPAISSHLIGLGIHFLLLQTYCFIRKCIWHTASTIFSAVFELRINRSNKQCTYYL